MSIAGRGQAEQFLKQPVDRGRSEKIPPAHDVGDALAARRRPSPPDDSLPPGPVPEGRRRPSRPGRPFACRRSSLRRTRAKQSLPGRARARHRCRAATRLFPRAPGALAAPTPTGRGNGPRRSARRRDRARPQRAPRPPGCRSTGRRGLANGDARAPPRSRRHARFAAEATRQNERRARRDHQASSPHKRACSALDRGLQCAAAGARRSPPPNAGSKARNRRVQDAAGRWASGRTEKQAKRDRWRGA